VPDACEPLRVRRFGFELLDNHVKNPGQSAFRQLTPPIDDPTLQRALCGFLRGWKVELRYDRHGYGATSQWLVKTFEFSSFELAMRFMQEGAEACRNLNHHPTWENTYKPVVVRTTTWNAAHRITHYDIDLARRFDRIAANVMVKAD
jgi:4a-hydroxytetrahydrobiopterin dehydratase